MAVQVSESISERVHDSLSTLTQHDFVAEAFAGFVVVDEKARLRRWEQAVEVFKSLIINCQGHGPEIGQAPLKCLIEEIYSGKYSARRLGVILDFFNRLIAEHCFTARQVCEFLLNSPALSPNNPNIWVSVFRFVDDNLCNVDYKGCRELLKSVLDKASSAFASDVDGGRKSMPQLRATYNLISRMLDRRNYFLPSYIAANSVKTDERLLRHWKFGSLLHPFLAGFRPIADILTPTGRYHYSPVLGFSALCSLPATAWHLSLTTLRFQLLGPLPHRDEALQPQVRLFSWLLKHTYSKEVIHAVLALPNPTVPNLPATMSELELAGVLADAATTKPYQVSGEIRLWQHLLSQSMLLHSQLPGSIFSRLASCLIEKLKNVLASASTGKRIRGNRYKRLGEIFSSRDCLMFLLAQYVAVGLQKSSPDDYLPVFEIYDVLYNFRPSEDEEDDDTTSSSSDDENGDYHRLVMERRPVSNDPGEFICSFAPATIWMTFKQKVTTDSGFCPPMPDSIKRSVDKLQSLYELSQRSPPGPGALAAGGGSLTGDPAPDLVFIAVSNSLMVEQNSPLLIACVDSLSQSTILGISNDSAYNSMEGSQLQQQLLSLPAAWSPLRAPNNIRPLSMARLDLCSILTRSGIRSLLLTRMRDVIIAGRKEQQSQSQQQQQLQNQPPAQISFVSPAFLETLSRLLAYHDIDTTCRRFSEFMMALASQQNYAGIFIMAQIISYRMPNLLQTGRMSFLKTFLTGMHTPPSNFALYTEIETAILALLNSMTPVEFVQLLIVWYSMADSSSKRQNPQGNPNPNQTIPIAFSFSEDINRIAAWKFVINMRIAGANATSNWASEAFAGFRSAQSSSSGNSLHLPLASEYLALWLPQSIIEILVRPNGYSTQSSTQEIDSIKRSLVSEFNKYATIPVNTKFEYAKHMDSPMASAVFFCLVCRLIAEQRGPTKAFCVRCLDRVGGPSKPFSRTIHCLIEYLVDEVANAGIQKYTPIINEMIYQRGIFSVDRIILAMIVHPMAPASTQDCTLLSLITALVSSEELSQRISASIAHYSANHWLDGEGFAGHTKYHSLFQETGLYDSSAPDTQQPMPVYFGNCCLRLIRVLDYCFYRWLPLAISNQSIAMSLSRIIECCGQLYAFHPKPILFIHTCLYLLVDQSQNYSESVVQLAGKLTVTVLTVIMRHRDLSWAFPQRLLDHNACMNVTDLDAICAEASRRLSLAIQSDPLLSYNIDYRFAEFTNPAAHAHFGASIDLIMASLAAGSGRVPMSNVEQQPINGVELVTQSLLKLVFEANLDEPRQPFLAYDSSLDHNGRLHTLCNSVALLLCSLPLCYLSSTFSTIEQIVRHLPEEFAPHMLPLHPIHLLTSSLLSPTLPTSAGIDMKCGRLLALCHAILHHGTFAHLSMLIAVLVRNHLAPLIVTEEQLLFLFAVFGPYMSRINNDPGNRQLGVDLATILYELLAHVDVNLAMNGQHIVNVNTVADFFYHLKYHYIGDAVRGRVESSVAKLTTPGLQHQLRFVVTSAASQAQNAQAAAAAHAAAAAQSAATQSANSAIPVSGSIPT